MSFLFQRISASHPASMTKLYEAHEIRHRVFIEEQGIPDELDIDGNDQISEHVLIREQENGPAIGTGRLTPISDKDAVLARIAVLPAFRGKGLGRQIIQKLESYALEIGITSLSLSPHAHLETFYQTLGYEVLLGQQETVGKYHLIKMQKNLPSAL